MSDSKRDDNAVLLAALADDFAIRLRRVSAKPSSSGPPLTRPVCGEDCRMAQGLRQRPLGNAVCIAYTQIK